MTEINLIRSKLKPHSWLKRFSLFVALSTLFLIVAGALVTSTGSGLAVPDWPLSFGQFFPPMVGGVLFEHGHRMIAGTVGLLTGILACWMWKVEKRKWLVGLGFIALVSVILQAVLGGLTVLYRLPFKISTAHAILAQTFFCITVAIAYFVNATSENVESYMTQISDIKILFKASFLLTCSIYTQLFFGALLRHYGGSSLLNFHIATAIIVIMISSFITFKFIRNNRIMMHFGKWILSMNLLILLQIFLGLFTAFPGLIPFALSWPLRVAAVTSHVALGATLLAGSLIITLKSYRFLSPDLFIVHPNSTDKKSNKLNTFNEGFVYES